MADRYANFAALAKSEMPGAYAIRLRDAGSKVVVAAPHGGAIEPGTSEVALALAADDFSYYLFEGKRNSANAELHITSTNFDEPQCLRLIACAEVVVAVHGEASVEPVIFLGGRHSKLAAAMRDALVAGGFRVETHDRPDLQGRDSTNIVNRGSTGAGVQLELSRGLREEFFASLHSAGRAQPTQLLGQFALTVRGAISASGL